MVIFSLCSITWAKETTITLEFSSPADVQDWTEWFLDKNGEDTSGFYAKTWGFNHFKLVKDVPFKPRSLGGCMNSTEAWVDIPAVCDYLKISKETVYRWIKNKPNFPAHKIGRQWRFKLSEIEAWVKEK